MVKRLEIDQSVRVEELNKDTILGVANKQVSFTALISKKIKRVLYEKFRRWGKPKKFAPYVFAAAVSKTLKKTSFESSDIIIDIEYPGYEQEILNIIKQQHPKLNIYFTAIGKKFYAHFVAYGAHIGKRSVDYRITAKNLLNVLKEIKK